MTVGDIVGEAIDIHKLCRSKKERYDATIVKGEEIEFEGYSQT